MSVKINQEDCIGCGVCMQVCPQIFGLDEDEGKATILLEEAPESERDTVKEAIDSCPIGCIND